MTNEITREIANYINHFRSEHAKLASLGDDLHKRILVVTMLSALSEGRYTSVESSGAKFITFVETYCAWSDSKSISVAMLAMAENAKPKLSSGMMQKISSLAEAWRKLNAVGLDPPATEVITKTISSADRARIGEFKHSALLWLYRSKLVHEYRTPGHGMEFTSDNEPFYHSMTHLDDNNRQTKELVYPVNWLLALVPPALEALERDYRDSNVNPYDSYDFGSPWRRKKQSKLIT